MSLFKKKYYECNECGKPILTKDWYIRCSYFPGRWHKECLLKREGE